MVTTGIDLGPLIVDEDTVTYLDYCTLADVEAYAGVNFSDEFGLSSIISSKRTPYFCAILFKLSRESTECCLNDCAEIEEAMNINM